MNELVEATSSSVATRPLFFAATPKEQVKMATEMAEVLSDIITKQKLYSEISGKKYVKVEGWQTLGTFLGITARESRVTRHDDGSYEAFVDLIKFADGTIVGGASALCSSQEKRWGNADEFARRSMAITRATGKAYRCAFAWIVTLAGYEPTPEEEMPASMPRKSEETDQKISTAQISTLVALVKKQGIKGPEIAELIGLRYNKTATNDLTAKEFHDLCEFIEKSK